MRRLASNAAANVTNGAAAAVFQLGLTAIMARTGDPHDLVVWSLAASLASLAPLLGCNLCMAVARRLAVARGDGPDAGPVRAVMFAAQVLTHRLVGTAFGLALFLGVAVPLAYPHLCDHRPWTTGITVAGFFFGSSWIVRSQPLQGWLLAAHRNWPIAAAGLYARAAAIAAAWALLANRLPGWAIAVAAGTTLWIAVPSMARHVRPELESLPMPSGPSVEQRHLTKIAVGFAAWAASSTIIQGSTVPWVAWLEPSAATPFFLAFTLVTVIVGAVTAAANALVSPIAILLVQKDLTAARALARRSGLLSWLSANLALGIAYATLPMILRMWTGTHGAQAAETKPFFALLALQHGIRSSGIVPSIVLAAGAAPRTMLRAIVPEACLALLLAVPLGAAMGPHGFLLGLAVAATAGVLTAATMTSREVLAERSLHWGSTTATILILTLLTAFGWLAAVGLWRF
ncbi:MAG: hypothetical protein KGN16_03280 [Burkholderiales bacterium]|nr:hypothetical protein [Burkholderiales bacterium]